MNAQRYIRAVASPAQEFRETRDWLKQHKHDPFLWLIIVMPLSIFALNFGGPAILSSKFPSADAISAFGQVAPNVDVRVGSTKIPCKLPRGTYLFGYVLVGVQNGKGTGPIGPFLNVNGFGPSTVRYGRSSHNFGF